MSKKPWTHEYYEKQFGAKKAFMEIIHFGGKNHEFTIIKCEKLEFINFVL